MAPQKTALMVFLEKAAGNEKGDGAYATAAMLFPRLRRLSRVQSDSPRGLHGNPRKNLSILSLDSSERELFQESHGPFPLLSYPRRISLVFAEEKLFPLPPSCLTPARLSRERKGARRSEWEKKNNKSRKKKKKEKTKKKKRRSEKWGAAAPLKEVERGNPQDGGPFLVTPSGYARNTCTGCRVSADQLPMDLSL